MKHLKKSRYIIKRTGKKSAKSIQRQTKNYSLIFRRRHTKTELNCFQQTDCIREVEGDIGTITEDGIFTLADTVNKDGKIKVTAGDLTKEIPVHISDYPSTLIRFYDTENHWAKDIIADMAGNRDYSGFEENREK